jgi:tetratricopeptide (TPR) repeat protein
MNQPALLFNPSVAPTDELEAVFVARRPLLDSVVEILRQQTESKTTQHVLLIGPRGSGKTHLTEILARRITCAAPPWRAVRMPEESYSFVGLDELMFAIASRDAGKELAWDAAVPSIDASLAALELQRRESKRPLLVILENLPRVLTKVLRGEQEIRRFRAILMSDSPFTLVATATSYFEDITRESRPLYDFFRIFVLQDLKADEVEELVTKRAQWDQDPAVLQQMDTLRKRIRAIHHLSGGNPRLVLALYDIIARGVSRDIHRQFVALLDRVTPYYQSRIEDLSPQQAQVLVRLAIAPRALAASTLARAFGRPTSHITAVLDVLLAERFIQRIVSKSGARTTYAVSDRLFRIWLEMRENRGARGRLRFLVEFYRMAYTRKELEQAVFHWSYEFSRQIKYSWTSGCEDHALMIDYLSEALRLSSEAQKNRLFHVLSYDNNDLDNAIEQFREAARETSSDHPAIAAALHLALAQRLFFMGRPQESVVEVDAAEKLLPGDSATGYLRAISLFAQQQFEQAIAASLEAERLEDQSESEPDVPLIQMHALLRAASSCMLAKPGASRLLAKALRLDECKHCVALRCKEIVVELPASKSYQSRVETILKSIMHVVGEELSILSALATRAIRSQDHELARQHARKLTALKPEASWTWVKLACAEANLANLSGFVEAISKIGRSATGRERAHLLHDVAYALRRSTAPMLEAEQLAGVLGEMRLNEEDFENLYRGLWRSLKPGATPEWAADVICMIETLGTGQHEPWHSFMEFVRNEQPESFLESLHPEIREAIVVLTKELESGKTSTTFDALRHLPKNGASRRRTSKATSGLN